MASAVGGLVTVAILSSFIGIIGTIFGAAIGGIGVWLSFKMQDTKGLYNKTKNEGELHILPMRFRNTKLLQKVNHESKEKNI